MNPSSPDATVNTGEVRELLRELALSRPPIYDQSGLQLADLDVAHHFLPAWTFSPSSVQRGQASGKEGTRKLWSAVNIRVAHSALSADEFLPFIPQLAGERHVVKRQTSTQTRGRSTFTSIQRERIMDVPDLAACPRVAGSSSAPVSRPR